jgi:hypothetical protein
MLLVRLSDPAYQTELMVFLRNSGVDGVARRGTDVQVADLDEDPLTRILDTWRGLHPGVRAVLIREEA